MARRRPFYGWAIAGMGTLGNAVQGGLVFWSMGIYTSTFEDHFQASRARVTLIETFISIGVNVLSPFLGLAVDRGSARHIVALGAAALGLGFIVLSMAGTLLHVWLVFFLMIPIGVLSVGMLPSSALISRWFRRRRGLALGISVTGSSIGGALAPPAITFLFVAYGWRTAFLIVGLFIIALAPVFFKVLANHPEDKGLEAEEAGDDEAAAQADAVDWSVREILRQRPFWLQTLISGSMLCVTLGLLANLSLHAKGPRVRGSVRRCPLLDDCAVFVRRENRVWGADRPHRNPPDRLPDSGDDDRRPHHVSACVELPGAARGLCYRWSRDRRGLPNLGDDGRTRFRREERRADDGHAKSAAYPDNRTECTTRRLGQRRHRFVRQCFHRLYRTHDRCGPRTAIPERPGQARSGGNLK